MLPLLISSVTNQNPPDTDWPNYGNDPGGMRYSHLNQITTANVKSLKIAWRYRHGDMAIEPGNPKSSFQCTPVVQKGTLYFTTPFSRVIALDAKSGALKWQYDPKINRTGPNALNSLVHRGLALYTDSATQKTSVIYGTYDGRLISLNSQTGKLNPSFGNKGVIDLKKGLSPIYPGEYAITAPPTVVNNSVVIGSCIADNFRAKASDGSIRAFDARTGKLLWKLNPAPKGAGGANAWAVMSADPGTNTVFIPTSSPSPDRTVATRTTTNEKLANALLAVDATTGKLKWSFQTVHRDVWNYDLPAQPILCSITHNNQPTRAVVVLTKMGFVFALDQKTGKPLFPVQETPVPASNIPGETLSPTQPIPTKPAPLVPQVMTPDQAWGPTAADQKAARDRLAQLVNKGLYGPPTLGRSLQFPSDLGGCNWSGGSFDPTTETLYTNVNNFTDYVLLTKTEEESDFGSKPRRVRETPYSLLHGPFFNRSNGLPLNPPPWGSLVAVNLRTGDLKWSSPLGIAKNAKGMPGAEAWGSLNLGGATATGGGLVFIGGASDNVFRAFNAVTGKVVWEYPLPAGGNATPMSYQIDGKQYVVICAGGHSGLETKIGDYVLAFTLP